LLWPNINTPYRVLNVLCELSVKFFNVPICLLPYFSTGKVELKSSFQKGFLTLM
jgi:hypothetical protein